MWDPNTGESVIGTDSQITAGETRVATDAVKVWPSRGILCGFAGNVGRAQAILRGLPTGKALVSKAEVEDFALGLQPPEEEGDDEDDMVEFLLGTPWGVVTVDADCILWHSAEAVIGSGWEHALGSLATTKCLSMSVEERVRWAVEAACTYNIYCCLPVQFYRIGGVA